MKKLIRRTLTLASALFALLLGTIFLPIIFDITELAAAWFSVPGMILAGWLTWKSLGGETIGAIASIFTGAILVGGLSFSVGFFGPMLLVPSANQGPLLGILITGPAGVVLGAIGGFIYWLRINNKSNGIDSV